MQVAYTAKFNSGCVSRQVGAVVADKEYAIKAIGWNDVPYGHVPCNLRSADYLIEKKDIAAYSPYELHDKKFRPKFTEFFKPLRKNENISGINFSYCFKDIQTYC